MNPIDAAQLMVDELVRKKFLYQEQTAHMLHKLDKTLTYNNDKGNLAISKVVLTEFRKLTETMDVVWSRSERHWRFRNKYDKMGRMQD